MAVTVDIERQNGWPAWIAEARAMLALAWPLILANLAQHAIITVDVVMMGWLGPEALAAGALGGQTYFPIYIIGIGLATAAAPMIASERGRKRHSVREVRRTVRQAWWTVAAVSLPAMGILWAGEAIFLALGQQAELAALAGTYLFAVSFAYFPALACVVMRLFLSAMERPGWVLAITIGATFFNGFANWCLMFGNLGFPALGLPGAGWATLVTNLVMFGAYALVVSLDRQFRRFHLFGRFWRADWPRFAEIWRLGTPIAVTLGMEATFFTGATLLMGLIGLAELAAHQIALQIGALTFMVPLGLAQASTVRVGIGFGARNDDHIRRAGWTAFVLGVGFMAAMALVIVSMPRTLIGVFLDLSDPAAAATIEAAVSFLMVAAIFQVGDGAQVIGAGMLRGLQDTRVPMVFALVGYWVIGLAAALPLAFWFDLGGVGIWYGIAIGLFVVAVMMILRWSWRERLGLTRATPYSMQPH